MVQCTYIEFTSLLGAHFASFTKYSGIETDCLTRNLAASQESPHLKSFKMLLPVRALNKKNAPASLRGYVLQEELL